MSLCAPLKPAWIRADEDLFPSLTGAPDSRDKSAAWVAMSGMDTTIVPETTNAKIVDVIAVQRWSYPKPSVQLAFECNLLLVPSPACPLADQCLIEPHPE